MYFPGRVDHVEVRDLEVRPVRLGEVLPGEHLGSALVLGAPLRLKPPVRRFERVDGALGDGGPEAHADRVAVTDRLLKGRVGRAVDAVRHRDHVVEAGEEDVGVAMAEELSHVGEESRLERLEIHLATGLRRRRPRPVVVDLDEGHLSRRHSEHRYGTLPLYPSVIPKVEPVPSS